MTDRPGIQRIENTSEAFGIPIAWSMRKAKRYTADRVNEIHAALRENRKQQETSTAIGKAQAVTWIVVYDTDLELSILSGQRERLRKELKQYQTYLKYLNNPPKNDDLITDDMIERAREYPVREILDTDRKRINCPVCGRPRALVRETAVSCFRCRKRYDSIALVMHLRGLTFIEAVKLLAK